MSSYIAASHRQRRSRGETRHAGTGDTSDFASPPVRRRTALHEPARPATPPPPYSLVDTLRSYRTQGCDARSSNASLDVTNDDMEARRGNVASTGEGRPMPQYPSINAPFGLDLGHTVVVPSNNVNDSWPSAVSAALCYQVAARLSDLLSRLDGQDGREKDGDEAVYCPNVAKRRSHARNPSSPRGRDAPESSTFLGWINFEKTWFYANSRLPPHMPPVKVYTETWPILCRAAQASEAVYSRRQMRSDETIDYVDADWRLGTKAMMLKSVPLDDKNLIVLAIRGSKWNLADWAINFKPGPVPPIGFLYDEGNACHAGFLQVAKAMVTPIAARLRELLQQDPSRAASSLVLTGHSAGGAVASLLYMHMVAFSVESELNLLTGCFRRVHCVTFGAPPVSLMPMKKPKSRRFASSVFMSLVNEGDPVVRADREYLGTLARVVASSTPDVYPQAKQASKLRALRTNSTAPQRSVPQPPYCFVPEAVLSPAGRLVLLRIRPGHKHLVEQVGIEDGELRTVVFGDPSMHSMILYKERIDGLAIAAITGRNTG